MAARITWTLSRFQRGKLETQIMPSYAPRHIRDITAVQLHDLIDETKSGSTDAIRQSVEFVIAESFGYWHNRARAKLCRHFKNHRPKPAQCDRMVTAIIGRLISGNFYEQFRDQLSMAIRFDSKRMKDSAAIAIESDREYIRRYGNRVLHSITSIPDSENAR